MAQSQKIMCVEKSQEEVVSFVRDVEKTSYLILKGACDEWQALCAMGQWRSQENYEAWAKKIIDKKAGDL